MLRVSALSKSFGAQQVLSEVSFVISRGDHAGLIGPNGAGKSTLLDIIVGRVTPDDGHARVDLHARIGYLPQGLEPAAHMSVAEAVRSAVPGLEAARQQMERAATALVGREPSVDQIEAYSIANERFEALGGYEMDVEMPVVLSRLGLAGIGLDVRVERLSGGQRARVALAGLLLSRPDILLLDEPTNHLDFDGLEWVEGFVKGFSGAALIVSHDRVFLDRTVTRIFELDAATHRLTEFAGNYSTYAAEKARRLQAQWSAYRDQELEVQKMKTDLARLKARSAQIQGAGRRFAAGHDHYNRIAKKVARLAVSRERKLDKYLESSERVGKPAQQWRLKLKFQAGDRGGDTVAALSDCGFSFGGGPVLADVGLVLKHGDRVALVGPNGSGKTTLLRLLAGELTPSAGSLRLGANVKIGYLPQQQEDLPAGMTPLSLMRGRSAVDETEARTFLHQFLFTGDQVFTRVGNLSYGERVRLMLALLVASGCNLLLLDEPLNHLDIPSRERFEEALEQFSGTVVTVTHDRAFIAAYATSVWGLVPYASGSALHAT